MTRRKSSHQAEKVRYFILNLLRKLAKIKILLKCLIKIVGFGVLLGET